MLAGICFWVEIGFDLVAVAKQLNEMWWCTCLCPLVSLIFIFFAKSFLSIFTTTWPHICPMSGVFCYAKKETLRFRRYVLWKMLSSTVNVRVRTTTTYYSQVCLCFRFTNSQIALFFLFCFFATLKSFSLFYTKMLACRYRWWWWWWSRSHLFCSLLFSLDSQ